MTNVFAFKVSGPPNPMFPGIAVACAVLIILRLCAITPGRRRSPALKQRERSCNALIFVGSGKFAEMMTLLRPLNPNLYTPRSYLIAQSDTLSESKVKEQDTNAIIYRLPRAREVGQSWLTVPLSMARALAVAIQLEVKVNPELILCNGPGSCIPICMAAYLVAMLGVRRPQIVYVESFARVTSLSLTGKLLYLFVDRFIVQWPELTQKYPKAEYLGMLA
ncbi:oligosaccharide biosynthesis protein Alg14 like-domain-containing protein [Fennellomyces sp. T-0311]|nr:oligosaccharide biosynthesis protein Alg14 like-domain-containing protein [Fennellomyces sp. T-0311]